MREELVGETELKKAKELRMSGLYLGLETSDQYADFYAFPELLDQKVRTPEQKAKIIESVKAKEIMAIAKEIFKNEGMNLSIVGPYKDVTDFEEVFKI